MVFNSLTFIVFFAIVLALFWMPFSWKTRKIILLVASYLFYAAWNPPFILLLWISTVVDWWAANRMALENAWRRRAWMLLSVTANLGMLGLFKYGEFLLTNFSALAAPLAFTISRRTSTSCCRSAFPSTPSHDVLHARRISAACRSRAQSMLDFALFVTFFPQLVAGPIMRPTEIVPQFAEAAPRQRSTSCVSAWR